MSTFKKDDRVQYKSRFGLKLHGTVVGKGAYVDGEYRVGVLWDDDLERDGVKRVCLTNAIDIELVTKKR